MYQKVLMDHFKRPRNKKKIENPTFESGENNPSCGDSISMTGIVEDGIIKDLGFDGSGCVISLAAASMLTELCIEKSVEEVLCMKKDDVLAMIGMELGPNRLRCAMLALETLKKGLSNVKD